MALNIDLGQSLKSCTSVTHVLLYWPLMGLILVKQREKQDSTVYLPLLIEDDLAVDEDLLPH